MSESFIQKISANLPEDDVKFLDTIHKNHSEAIRILIRNARNKNGRRGWFRQVLLNISIGFVALALFFIWASIISWIFIILAVLIFSYEIFDLAHSFVLHRREKETLA